MPAMISRHGGRGRRTINEINMVPFIDVMLVLLIIFMVTAPLISPSTVNLPSMAQAPQQTEAVIQVVLGSDGQLQVSTGGVGKPVALNALGSLVKTAQSASQSTTNKGSPVVISADKSVKYESVVQVMDQLQRAGVQRVGLSVQVGGK